MSYDVITVILIIYCFIAVWFVGGLTVFHFYLICTNQVSFFLNMLLSIIRNKKWIQTTLYVSYYVLIFAFLQTTYENFRYRYNKNKNPYNKGILKNFLEFSFGKTPPSMFNFRAWVVTDDHDIFMHSHSMTRNFNEGSVNLHKPDVEVGNQFSKPGGAPVPQILKSLDYSGIEEGMQKREGEGKKTADDTPLYPSNSETRYRAELRVDQEPRYPHGVSNV